MNYFVEGIQGSGKSSLVQKLSEIKPGFTAIREGDYSPVELAWCSYVDEDEYQKILARYPELRSEIEDKTVAEGDKKIIRYTQIITDTPGFHKDLEQYEIYNGNLEYQDFKNIVINRYKNWNSDGLIFECSIFQNIVEDMILYRQATDQEIFDFYKLVKDALTGKDYRIIYLQTEDLKTSIDIIRKERSDGSGNEMWFPLMSRYFDESPYAKANGLAGEDALLEHFRHRQELELKICSEIFPENTKILISKKFDDIDLLDN